MQRQLDRCGNKRKKFGILGGEKSDIGTYSVNIQRMCREKHKRREREKMLAIKGREKMDSKQKYSDESGNMDKSDYAAR